MPDAPAVALHILAALQAVKLDASVSGISAGLVGHRDAAALNRRGHTSGEFLGLEDTRRGGRLVCLTAGQDKHTVIRPDIEAVGGIAFVLRFPVRHTGYRWEGKAPVGHRAFHIVHVKRFFEVHAFLTRFL